MRRIFLIRHGQPDFPDGLPHCIGSADFPLSPLGHEQAKALAHAFEHEKLSVFASPLKRAYDTATALSPMPIVIDDLREMHAGDWDGLSFEQIKQRWPELYEARANNTELPLPNEEDWYEGQRRFLGAVEKALASCEGDIAIVAHTTVILSFICHVMQDEGYKSFRWRPDYCGWYTVELDEKGMRCIFPWQSTEGSRNEN